MAQKRHSTAFSCPEGTLSLPIVLSTKLYFPSSSFVICLVNSSKSIRRFTRPTPTAAPTLPLGPSPLGPPLGPPLRPLGPTPPTQVPKIQAN